MKKLITAILLLCSGTALAQMTLNSDIVVNAQRSVDGKQYKIVANKHVPYVSSIEYLSIIPATRRHVGQIGYVANGSKIDVWQFVGGIADSNFHLVSIKLPANNSAGDSILSTDVNGTALLKYSNPWNKTGNSGTSPVTDFIGNTDNKSLRFRTNNVERLRIDSNASKLVIGANQLNLSSGGTNQLNYSTGGTHAELDIYAPAFSGIPDAISSDYISTWNTGWTYGSHLLNSYYGLTVSSNGASNITAAFLVKRPNVVTASPLFTVFQDGVYINDSTHVLSSAFTINSTTKGVLLTHWTNTQRNAINSPATGLIGYNTSTNYFNYQAGGSWRVIPDTGWVGSRIGGGGGVGGGGGSLRDTTYGDITVSLGGTAMNINDSVINANNIHDVAASTITGTRDHTFISDFATSKAGSADTFATARNIFGYPFNGSADLSGIISSTYLPASIPYNNQLNIFTQNQIFTGGTNFQTNAGNSAIHFSNTVVGGDPTSPNNGDFWYAFAAGQLRYRTSTATRVLANLDEAQTFTNKDFSSSTNTFPGINYFLPSQIGNAGKVLQSDGTNTSWKVKTDSIRAVNDSTLRTYSSDGTHTDITLVDPGGQIDSSEHTISPTISFTTAAGTNPSGTTNNTYQWSQVGKMVTVRFNVSWGTVGTGTVSAISFNMPADLPTPKRPTGFTTATDYLYIGDGYLTTTKNSVNADRGRSFIAYDGTNYTVIIKIQTAAAIQYGYATIQYFVP